MKLKDVKQVLKTMLEHKSPVTPMLWGRHGLGKSAIVAQLGNEVGYKVLSILLSQKEAVDVAGVLYTYQDPDLGVSVTSAHPPVWFAEAVKKGKVIIFCDEFNMARKEVMNAAFELVLDRRLNNLRLPDSVFIVCAGNPDDERYDVTPLSESLRDRLMHIQVTPDTDGWLDWATQAGAKGSPNIDPSVAKFIRMSPKAAFSEDEKDEKFPVEIKHSYRSWERVSIIHRLPLPMNLKYECFRGIIGPDLATAFVKSLNLDKAPLEPSEIFGMSSDTIERIKDFCNEKNMRMDLLSQSVDNLVTYCKNNPVESTKHIESVKRFIEMLPDDLASLAIAGVHELPGWAENFMKDKSVRSKIGKINQATVLAKKATKEKQAS